MEFKLYTHVDMSEKEQVFYFVDESALNQDYHHLHHHLQSW